MTPVVDNPYRSPSSDDSAADTSRLSKDEWRYAAKVFAMATLALSILAGLWLTVQTIYALRAFNAERHVAGIVAVSGTREIASRSVQSAVCLALVLVVHRRTKNDVAPPRSGLFAPMFLIVPVVTPFAGLLMCTVSMLLLLFGYDQGFAIAWESINKTFRFSDIFIGMLLAAADSLVFAVLGPELARMLDRYYIWPILGTIIKCFLAAILIGIVNFLVGTVIWRIIYVVIFGETP